MSVKFLKNKDRIAEQYQRVERLVDALRSPEAYVHTTIAPIEVIETHISWVLLTGPFAYKIKKPLDLGFVDYSTLPRREFFCREELRLNRRLAPEIYLQIVPITAFPNDPMMDGKGQAIEFAVKMRQFSQDDLLSERIQHQQLSHEFIERLAHRVARFHADIAIAPEDSSYGTPEAVLEPMQRNFETLRAELSEDLYLQPLPSLERWIRAQHERFEPLLHARKHQGFIRECHGDMHLGNIALVDDQITIFDGIEFNEHIRWIDIASELAFLVMDLDDRGAPELSQRLLNHYLMATGDYGGLPLLRFYQVYRAMVRAKVNAIRASQVHLTDAERLQLLQLYQDYIELARCYTRPHQAALMITYGLSGSGKSALSQQLADHAGVIWLRSDVERKRLFGLKPLEHSHAALDAGIYTAEATEQTYQRLLELAESILGAHFTVLIDATFLKHIHRIPFAELARKQAVPFRILTLEVSQATLRQRVLNRSRLGQDPSEASIEVLYQQDQTQHPLTPEELKFCITIDSERAFSAATVHSVLTKLSA
jgi:hypothetical protein